MKSLVVGITGLVLMVWVGPSGGQGTNPTVSDNQDNTAGGSRALELNLNFANTDGASNTAFGSEALFGNLTGHDNTGVGSFALFVNNIGNDNTGVGSFALRNNVSSGNTAIGSFALTNNNSGNNNTAVGIDALLENRTGRLNTALGAAALNQNLTGSGNTAVGFSALSFSTGNNNTAIGPLAGSELRSGSENIYLRAVGVGTESNTMRLGRAVNTQRTFIAGIRGENVDGVADGVPVLINNQGRLGIQLSSARYKRDIQSMGTGSQGLLQLRPVTFRYKRDVQELQYGLIAEEVAEVYPELVTRGDNGEVESVRYQGLIPMLLNELQHQQGQLGAQVQQLSVLKADNERLQAMVAHQQERDAALTARLERLEGAAIRAATLISSH